MPRHRAEQDIDVGELEKLALLHCTQGECAAFFGVTEETMCRVLKRTAAHRDAYQRGLQRGKLSIRRKQYELAMAGDKTMLIWLGKQLLGQVDRQETKHTGGEGGPMQIVVEHVGREEWSGT